MQIGKVADEKQQIKFAWPKLAILDAQKFNP